MTTETETALATTDDVGTANATAESMNQITREKYSGPAVITSLPAESKADLIALFNATGSDSIPLKSVEGERIELSHYVMQRGSFQGDDDDDEKSVCKLWLILADDRKVFSMADSVAKELAKIVGMFGPAPWDKPLPLTFHKTLNKNDRPWWHCEIDPIWADEQ